MTGRPVLILAALAHEAGAIRKAVRDLPGVQVRVIGPSAKRLGEVEKPDPGALVVMAGVAGGLDPSLRTGDVVVDELSDVSDVTSRWRRGKIYHARGIVATPAEKADLFRSTGAVAVDMESEPVRGQAREWGVGYVGLRAVLDTADEALDPALLTLTDANGRLRVGQLVTQLLRRPTFLRTLLRMQSRSAAALGALSAAVRSVGLSERQP